MCLTIIRSMDILQITERFYIDIDEILLMQIIQEEEKQGVYSVIGVTKFNIQVLLFRDEESKDIQRCINWINENWVKRKQKKKLF